jgi:hypothetical protein
LIGAQAIVAHGTAARVAIEATAEWVGGIPASVARAKRRRLLAEEPYIRKRLRLLVRGDVITDELVNEARSRIADPRMDLIEDRTAEILSEVLTPVDAHINEVVSRRLVLLGEGPSDRKLRARAPATVVEAKQRSVLDDIGLALCRHFGRAFRCCFLSSQRLGFARCKARRRNGGTGSC